MNTITPLFGYAGRQPLAGKFDSFSLRKGFNRAFIVFLAAFLLLQGCTSVNTFPTIARAGDTVSVMVGGTEKARKNTIAVTLTDINGTTWDLQSLGLVRSVFNLRMDGRAEGLHYSPYLDSYVSWLFGHEPVQTVLVTDLPLDAAPGKAFLTISLSVNDDSSGVSDPFTVALELIGGVGAPDNFLRSAFGGVATVGFDRLEPAPHAKISFGSTGAEEIGAVSLVVDFDETVLNPDDINIYVPESTVRGSYAATGAFGKTQRMVYWHQDGRQLYADVVAPQGIQARYLQLYLIHPRGLSGSPNISLTSATIYDLNGVEIVVPVNLEYFP
ncbi:MAG TPA: hypothetical protein ENI68_07445 [Gammaproteobacteria bacterium]|nr:hypothetical protein [Gammaproteobacteria bacterium]